jgi:DNA-binding CsgD family transcriptional regulator
VASAYRGEAGLTKERAEESIRLAASTGHLLAALWAGWALGLLALSQDDPEAAHAALSRLIVAKGQLVVPIRGFFLPDEIEALISLGRLDEARRLLDAFEEATCRFPDPWALMMTERCRALLLAAEGELEQAAGPAAKALEHGEQVEHEIERARTLLIAGQVERRRRRKAAAAGHLRLAIEAFERMGAALWAQRARQELRRVGLRPAAPSELTTSERRVAELAAAGRTNREIAAQLFMSPKTVEANLARVYRKLDVRSRAQLVSHLLDTEPMESSAPPT